MSKFFWVTFSVQSKDETKTATASTYVRVKVTSDVPKKARLLSEDGTPTIKGMEDIVRCLTDHYNEKFPGFDCKPPIILNLIPLGDD